MTRLRVGVASAAYQVEGGVTADGRGPSIWDTFAARPGTVRDGSDGSAACGSYHRLDEDLGLVAGLGAEIYRFSVAWPRVQPEGRGPAVPAGLDYYDRLVDGLLARGVEPLPTLYHWDLPQALQDGGGWPARPTVDRFADYAALVHARLGDRVRDWATLNEPWCAAFLGHAAGIHAPGLRDPAAAFAAAHHLMLAHGRAAAVLRAGGARAGLVANLYPVHVEEPGCAAAAEVVDAIQNRLWLEPLAAGRYPAGLPVPDADGEVAGLRGSADWLGVNYYSPLRVGPPGETRHAVHDAFPGAGEFGFHPRGPRTTFGWEIAASGLTEVLLRAAALLPGVPLVVTENGAACPDDVRGPDGSVDDQDRIAYLRDHLAAVEEARARGAEVRGYLAWTLLDNFEWAEGYTQRFGLVEVERPGLRRRPKASYRWLAQRLQG